MCSNSLSVVHILLLLPALIRMTDGVLEKIMHPCPSHFPSRKPLKRLSIHVHRWWQDEDGSLRRGDGGSGVVRALSRYYMVLDNYNINHRKHMVDCLCRYWVPQANTRMATQMKQKLTSNEHHNIIHTSSFSFPPCCTSNILFSLYS